MRKKLMALLSFILVVTTALPIHAIEQNSNVTVDQTNIIPEQSLEEDFNILYDNLEGVPSESGSHAGGVTVIGENAFVVAVNPATSPLIAAAKYGDGRVIAAGMSEYIDLAGMSDIKSALTRNLLSWLTNEQETSYIDALAGNGEIELITNMDLDVSNDLPINMTKVNHWLEADLTLSDYNVAYVDNFNASLDEDEIEALLHFIDGGGALLFSQKGWVMNDHPKEWMKEKEQNPRLYHYGIQSLLNEVGISLMTNNAASKTEIFPPLPYEQAYDYHILQLIDQSKQVEEGTLSIDDIDIGGPNATPDEKRSIISTLLSGTVGGLTTSNPLLEQIQEDARTLDVALPFNKKENLYSSALFTFLVNQASLSPDQEKSQFADVFPGVVQADTLRIDNKEIEVDYDYADLTYLQINIPPGTWQSTGLYAPAGQLITIDVPESVENLDVQIGAHTDNLMGKDVWNRAPIVSYRQNLEPGINEIVSPYGGLVYLIPTEYAPNKKETISISGVVNAPYFNVNSSTNKEWNETIKHYDAPWTELEGRQIILTLPTDVAKQVDDPEALMEKWDNMVDQYDRLIGIGPDQPLPHKSMDRAHRFVFDIQVGAGLMHAGYPMVGPIQRFALEAIDLESPQLGSWGFWHEIGHQYQQKPWIWGDVGEVTTNIHSIHIEEYFGKESNLLTKDNNGIDYYDKALTIIHDSDSTKTYSDLELFERLVLFMQLEHAYGWDFYTDLHTAYRELPEADLPSNNQEKIDTLVYMTSKISGEDLVSFFEQWGLPVTQAAKEKVQVLNLPEPEIPVSTLRIYAAADIKIATMLDSLHSYEPFLSEDVYRLFNMHLQSVEHFEKQGQTEKVVKHMQSFNTLLDYQYDNEALPLYAYNLLKRYTESLIKKSE